MSRTHHLAIDPARSLAQQPQTGHNRWHEDIPPTLEVGAGDTVIATFTLAIAAGASPDEAAIFSNHAAGVVVGKLGTATVTREELLQSFRRER